MDATQLTDVVDKMAEKVGVVAEKLQPVAEEVMRQYQLRAVVYAVAAAGTAIVLTFAGSLLMRFVLKDRRPRDDDGAFFLVVLGGLMVVVGACLLFGVAVPHIGRAVAPLASILGF